jgi:hypothetical protein
MSRIIQKVKSSPCLIKYHAMKTYMEMEVHLHPFLTSALYEDEWSASGSGRFILEETVLHIKKQSWEQLTDLTFLKTIHPP